MRKTRQAAPRDWVVSVDDTDHAVTLSQSAAALTVSWNGRELLLESDWRPGEALFHGTLDGIAITVQVAHIGTRMRLSWRGAEAALVVRSPRAAELAARMPKRELVDLSRLLLSPMPGLMVSLAVNEGDEVRVGQALAVVDAMKDAAGHLEDAIEEVGPLTEALAAEQLAYQALLKLRAHEFEVTQSQQRSGSSSNKPNQQQLDQLELTQQ